MLAERTRMVGPAASPPPDLDRMFLHGIEVHGRHGALDFERRDGQRFVIDVDWWLDTNLAAATDRLGNTLCYKRLHDRVVAVTAGEPSCLIEPLAEVLTRSLLAHFPAMQVVTLTVHKPEAPIGGVFTDVGITMTRRRAGLSRPDAEDERGNLT
jgi:dihydroneopterin aldolase